MTDRERAIGARLKRFRETTHWPQPAFAEEIGLSRDQLASIEYGRSPLRYQVGVDICEVFDLSAEWLVTEKGEMHGGTPPILWVVEFDVEAYKDKLFSEVYDSNPEIFDRTAGEFRPRQTESTPGFDAEAYLIKQVIQWFRRTRFKSPLESELFARSVCEYAQLALQNIRKSGNATHIRLSVLKKQREETIKGLTIFSPKSKSEDMSEIQKLLKDVKKKVEKPGAKSELAKELGVAPARISEWLSGKKEPGGDYALRLLKWVAS